MPCGLALKKQTAKPPLQKAQAREVVVLAIVSVATCYMGGLSTALPGRVILQVAIPREITGGLACEMLYRTASVLAWGQPRTLASSSSLIFLLLSSRRTLISSLINLSLIGRLAIL
jgi:hypothetical protein